MTAAMATLSADDVREFREATRELRVAVSQINDLRAVVFGPEAGGGGTRDRLLLLEQAHRDCPARLAATAEGRARRAWYVFEAVAILLTLATVWLTWTELRNISKEAGTRRTEQTRPGR